MVQTKITFSNQPKLSEYDIQKGFNESRLNLVPKINDFLINHSRFKEREVNVTFEDKGVGSLVCLIETSGEKLILKIPLSKNNSGSEGLFLKVWEKAGVKVPRVFEEGLLNDHSYILMEYINTPLLNQADTSSDTSKPEIDLELGRILYKMHIPKAIGFGRVVDGKAEYQTFAEWVVNEKIKEAIIYVQKNKLLGDEHGSLPTAIEILTKHANTHQSSYCHFDFGSSNVFATNPFTVFDPNPQFNNGYLDLGLSIFNCISAKESPEHLIEGYFMNNECDGKVLHAAVLLNTYIKLPSRHKKNKLDQIKNIKNYHVKHKNLPEM